MITPAAARICYPTILELPAAELLAYNRETAIAEKFEAMVKLEELNSRMKDFFDVAVLAANFDFEGTALAAAIRATFERRQTAIQPDPVCFSDHFASDPSKASQWKAFFRRSVIANAPDFFQVVGNARHFLQPIALKLANGEPYDQHWDGGGPWRK